MWQQLIDQFQLLKLIKEGFPQSKVATLYNIALIKDIFLPIRADKLHTSIPGFEMPDDTLPTYRLADITVIDFLRELFPNIPAADFRLEVNSNS